MLRDIGEKVSDAVKDTLSKLDSGTIRVEIPGRDLGHFTSQPVRSDAVSGDEPAAIAVGEPWIIGKKLAPCWTDITGYASTDDPGEPWIIDKKLAPWAALGLLPPGARFATDDEVAAMIRVYARRSESPEWKAAVRRALGPRWYDQGGRQIEYVVDERGDIVSLHSLRHPRLKAPPEARIVAWTPEQEVQQQRHVTELSSPDQLHLWMVLSGDAATMEDAAALTRHWAEGRRALEKGFFPFLLYDLADRPEKYGQAALAPIAPLFSAGYLLADLKARDIVRRGAGFAVTPDAVQRYPVSQCRTGRDHLRSGAAPA